MKRKQGISLIVLVITIIVMVILAAAVVITLSNTGIINKANEAVNKTNKKQIEQLATLAWSEAFMEGVRTEEEFRNAVNEALKDVDTSGYEIIVTDKGVTVIEGNGTNNTPSLNEYGFYYEQMYTGTIAENPLNVDVISLVFYEDGSSDGYVQAAELDNKKILMMVEEPGSLNYANKSIKLGDGTESNLTVSEDGLTVTGQFEGFAITAKCEFEKMTPAYRDRTYSSILGYEGVYQAVLTSNNIAKLYANGTVIQEMPVTVFHNGHLIKSEGKDICYVSSDGEVLLLYLGTEDILFRLDNLPTTNEAGLYDIRGNLIASWQTLVDEHGLDVEKDYASDSDLTQETTHIYNIISKNAEYANTYHIKVSNKVKKIGNRALVLGNIESVKKVTIPEGVVSIGEQGLALSTNLTTVVLPSTLKSIGENAFFFSGITSLHIPAGVEALTPGFAYWSKTVSLTVDVNNPCYKSVNNVIYTKDGKRLIQSAMEIKEALVIPDGVEVITEASLAFANYTSLSIPASVTTIEKNAFEEMVDLTSITFAEGSKLTSIGEAAFLFCSNIESISIPEGVTEIKKNTFSGTSIPTITLPSTITSIYIGNDVEETMWVDKLVLKSQVPPTLPNGISLSATTDPHKEPIIVVPKGTGAAYKAATGWSTYAENITEATE